MAIYVVDATIIAEYVITSAYTAQAAELISRLNQPDELWIPEFCLLECTNVLWKRVRFDGADETDTRWLIIDLCSLPLTVVEVRDLLPRAFDIGLAHQLAVYDAVYIALADTLNCELITLDERQARAAKSIGVKLKPVTDFSPSSTS